jgi:hypothetical protein
VLRTGRFDLLASLRVIRALRRLPVPLRHLDRRLPQPLPQHMVVNRANKPVLLIDGEELAGAKQNRVLNTSILIKEVSETKIPVSCTE